MQNENGMMVYNAEGGQAEQLKPLLLPEAFQAWKDGEEPLILGLAKEQTAAGALAAQLEGGTADFAVTTTPHFLHKILLDHTGGGGLFPLRYAPKNRL